MKNIRVLTLILAILVFLPAFALAEAPSIPVEDYPMVDGSTATLPLSYALMSAATGATDEEARALIRHNKTTESFYSLVNGESDLLLVYAPSEDAYVYASERDVELEVKPIGRDALVFLINDKNPITSLTHEQILDVYSGKVTNWSELGGEDLDITAYQRIENSGSQVMMIAQVMKDTQLMEAPTERRPAEMGELIDEVASYRNEASAIGYSVYYYVHNMYMREGVKLLNINDVEPNNENISTGAYPYGQDFYAVIRADAPADSPERALFDCLSTPEGAALIESAGYVPMPQETVDTAE